MRSITAFLDVGSMDRAGQPARMQSLQPMHFAGSTAILSVSVSYTHLDVYKRQDLSLSLQNPWAADIQLPKRVFISKRKEVQPKEEIFRLHLRVAFQKGLYFDGSQFLHSAWIVMGEK